MINDPVKSVRNVVNSPSVLSQLINNKTQNLNYQGIHFSLLPTFTSEPARRASYLINSGDGIKYFFKVNDFTMKIRNEKRAFDLIMHSGVGDFNVPNILDFDFDVFWGQDDNQTCSWILEEWVDGQHVQPENGQQIDLAATLLSKINSLSVDINAIPGLSELALTNPDEVANNARRDMAAVLEKTLGLARGPIIVEFSRALDRLNINFCPFMLNLNHGDFHFKNILLSGSSANYIPTIIDWEDIALENPMYDLAHFLIVESPETHIPFLKTYFQEGRDLFVKYSQAEISEMLVLMYTFWLAKILRWKSKKENFSEIVDESCSRFYSQLKRIMGLPWKSIITY